MTFRIPLSAPGNAAVESELRTPQLSMAPGTHSLSRYLIELLMSNKRKLLRLCGMRSTGMGRLPQDEALGHAPV
jgi:hypothetical protein